MAAGVDKIDQPHFAAPIADVIGPVIAAPVHRGCQQGIQSGFFAAGGRDSKRINQLRLGADLLPAQRLGGKALATAGGEQHQRQPRNQYRDAGGKCPA